MALVSRCHVFKRAFACHRIARYQLTSPAVVNVTSVTKTTTAMSSLGAMMFVTSSVSETSKRSRSPVTDHNHHEKQLPVYVTPREIAYHRTDHRRRATLRSRITTHGSRITSHGSRVTSHGSPRGLRVARGRRCWCRPHVTCTCTHSVRATRDTTDVRAASAHRRTAADSTRLDRAPRETGG